MFKLKSTLSFFLSLPCFAHPSCTLNASLPLSLLLFYTFFPTLFPPSFPPLTLTSPTEFNSTTL